jgi:hypothetical protein
VAIKSVVIKKVLNKNDNSVIYYLSADATAKRQITKKIQKHKKNTKIQAA